MKHLIFITVFFSFALVTLNVSADPQVYNCPVMELCSHVDVSKKPDLKPVTIVGPRNSTFSGKVFINSDKEIKGVSASVTDLKGDAGTISKENIDIRYAVQFLRGQWAKRRKPTNFDILLNQPPSSPVKTGRWKSKLIPARLPIWVTVNIPEDSSGGDYTGTLSVQAEGLSQVSVTVQLTVVDWVMPESDTFRVWMGMIQSPDTLSIEYETPLWSDKMWEYTAQSFRHMRKIGCRNIYVPLLAGTNLGNEESFVRWIKKGNGYEYDYTNFEKYLDTAIQNLGKPEQVIFHVWDVYLSPKAVKNLPFVNTEKAKEQRASLAEKGPRVTLWNPETKTGEMLYLPKYQAPESKALWEPLWKGIFERMKQRGLEKTVMLGLVSDQGPSKEEIRFLYDVTGGAPWMSHAHPCRLRDKPVTGNKIIGGIADLGAEAHVYDLGYNVNPEKKRMYGWARPELTLRFSRNGFMNSASCQKIRLIPEFNITGTQRGLGRLGADSWFCIKNKRGERSGATYHRYPENNWRNLDIEGWMLAPGPEGPVMTARMESLREGIQECEARITIEAALIDPDKRSRLGELAEEAQVLLDERHWALWRSTWDNMDELKTQGYVKARYPMEALWGALAKSGVRKLPGYWDGAARKLRSEQNAKGVKWYIYESGWQERSRKTFEMAKKVEEKLK